MTAHVCPQCGKPLSSDAPQGLCPPCLFKAALPGQSALDAAATGLHDTSSAATISPEAGVHLKYFGDYELLEEIARGGMGVVWKARQTSLNRDVALKMIRTGALASPEEVQRFLREAEAAANLQHPNIVAIHEVGEHNGQHYFSMDYVAGRDLGALVKDGPLAPQRAANYVKIIAEAIQFAHQRGTLHRDLKPQNVLIDAADQPRITDFGLAKIMKDDSRLTQTGVIMGSPSYMPPEQAAGRIGDIGPASDVYSLGAMLYELLTGRPPFRGATPLATLHEVMESEPIELRRLKPDLPVDLETICLKCLEKSPSARYSTARALAEELDRYLKGDPILARPASVVRKTVSWARRHPGILAALAALVIVTLSFGVFYLFEENAFLRAEKEDPKLGLYVYPHQVKPGAILQPEQIMVLEPGPRHESLEMWKAFNTLAMFAGIFYWGFLIARVPGLSFKDWLWLDPAKRAKPTVQPLGTRTWTLAVGLALAMIGCGIMLLVKAIQAHVWEGESIWGDLLSIYGTIFFAQMIIDLLLRDYRLIHYGPASRELSAEQVASIRREMEVFNVVTAIHLYRTAIPDAGIVEADQYVRRLAESLRAQHPGKFVPAPLSLATLNWRTLLKGVLIAAAGLGTYWVLKPPVDPAWFTAELAGAFLLSMGLMAWLRVQGWWKRLLLLVPGLVVLTVTEVIRYSSAEVPAQSSGFWIGVFLSFFVMSCGLVPHRKQSSSKE